MKYKTLAFAIATSVAYIHNVASAPLIFNNVQDFEGQTFEHISFDPPDERTPAAIVAKFDNVSSFSLSGGQAAIRHISYTTFGGNGTDGGAVSGEYRIDWGYYGTSNVRLVFETPVDAVGAFFGGDAEAKADVIVTLENGKTFRATRASAGLGIVPNGASSCHAINGFVGVDSNDGPKITQVTFQEDSDAASLDSIFFGTAEGGSHGRGPTLFAETPSSNCATNEITLPQPPTSTAACQLYAVQDNGLNDTQLFTVNLDTLEIKALGDELPDYDIEALDIHPQTGVLYAASGDDTDNPGHLYTVNGQTGALTDLGYTGFDEIEGLSFQADTLWAWAKGKGLISINTQNGPVGTLVLPSSVQIEDLTWNNEGTQLYGAQDTNLWVSDGQNVEKACDLPGHTEALEMLPDNQLLLGVHGNKHILNFEIMDLTTCDLVQGVGIPTDYNDVEGIAWPEKACAE